LRAWAGPALGRLRAAGLTLTAHLFEDGNTQGVVFSAGTRTTLGLLVGADRLRAGLELSPARSRAVLVALASPARAVEVQTALEALPEQFEVAVEGDPTAVSGPRCTVDILRSMLERSAVGGLRLWIGWTVSRDLAVSHAALLDEQLTDSLVVLAPMLSLLGGTTEERPAAKPAPSRLAPRKKRAAKRADDELDAKRESVDIPIPGRKAGAPASRHEHEADGDAEPDRATARSGAEARGPSRFGLRTGGLKASTNVRAQSSRRRHDVVERGAQVRVLDGPFAGKVGVVQELDGRGGARVMLGLLAVRIDMTNLEVHVEGRRRPVLSTSHRKPVPARS
jgi:hypothetical protein